MVVDLQNKLGIMKSSHAALGDAIAKIEQNITESEGIFSSMEGLIGVASKFAGNTNGSTKGKKKAARTTSTVTASTKTKKTTKTGKERQARQGTLRSVILEVLNKHGKDGLALKEIVEKVIAHGGYKSTVDKENFPRLISQNLYQLKNDKMAAHDKETRKYSLVAA